jgi:hypothetical protein
MFPIFLLFKKEAITKKVLKIENFKKIMQHPAIFGLKYEPNKLN